jgi:hypothetical protein
MRCVVNAAPGAPKALTSRTAPSCPVDARGVLARSDALQAIGTHDRSVRKAKTAHRHHAAILPQARERSIAAVDDVEVGPARQRGVAREAGIGDFGYRGCEVHRHAQGRAPFVQWLQQPRRRHPEESAVVIERYGDDCIARRIGDVQHALRYPVEDHAGVRSGRRCWRNRARRREAIRAVFDMDLAEAAIRVDHGEHRAPAVVGRLAEQRGSDDGRVPDLGDPLRRACRRGAEENAAGSVRGRCGQRTSVGIGDGLEARAGRTERRIGDPGPAKCIVERQRARR